MAWRFVALGILAASLACGGAAAPNGPSVLLVTIDTLRADRVGAYGDAGARTPHLDRLAAEGLLFETALAVAPLTLPAHATLLTGLLPPAHGVRHNGMFRLGDAPPTLAERFRDAGYATGAVVAAAVLHRRYGLARGFDHYDDAAFEAEATGTGYAKRGAREVTDAARAWLADAPRPFFLWVHYYDPHAPYAPPPPFRERFAHDPYAGEVAHVDAELGRLLEALREAKELDGTFVAVTSDHGESLGEHGEPTHAHTLYDAVLRVPLVVRGPGTPTAARAPGPASSVDVAPSLLAAAGLPPLARAEGRDLGFTRAPGGETGSIAYAETLATRLNHGWAPLFAARSATHLYVRAPRPELYDVTRDPGQERDLLAGSEAARAAHAPLLAPLEAALDRALASERAGERLRLGAEAREQLRALGYVADDAPVAANGADPKDGLAWLARFDRAEALYRADRLGEAERIARDLLPVMGESPRLQNLLARVLLAQGRPEAALPPARAAVTLVPGSAEHREMLATVRRLAGDLAGAVDDYAAAAELDPSLPEARVGLMWRLAVDGDQDAAARHAEAARAVRPRDPRVALQVADVWDELGRYDRARDAYRALLRLDPAHPEAHRGLALQLVRLGPWDEVAAHLDAAGVAAEAPAFRLRLAVAWAARGEAARAAEVLEVLVARHPDWPAPRRVLARLRSETGS